jgi:hypothetical protein
MEFTSIEQVIPENRIVAFMPHYDDLLFGLGNYVLELERTRQLGSKQFHILLIFSRSNYQVNSGPGNFDTSLERIKLATGRRVLEDTNCLDELLGAHTYRYELLRENECMLRAKNFADSAMEFPHGMYEDFNDEDQQVFQRLQALVETWAMQPDTALVFPLAIKEHIDHFITREAGITTAKKIKDRARASFYFQEDKPYAGIQTPEESERIQQFVRSNRLAARVYRAHPERLVELGFKHYVSQVEDIYRVGVQERSSQLQAMYKMNNPCDRLFALE